jgi:hypothetical protein
MKGCESMPPADRNLDYRIAPPPPIPGASGVVPIPDRNMLPEELRIPPLEVPQGPAPTSSPTDRLNVSNRVSDPHSKGPRP